MSRRRLSTLVLALAAAALAACTSPTAPDRVCGGGVMTGSGTCMVANQ
jgi:hypothetical protein